jgi:hypothetical protein
MTKENPSPQLPTSTRYIVFEATPTVPPFLFPHRSIFDPVIVQCTLLSVPAWMKGQSTEYRVAKAEFWQVRVGGVRSS